MSFSCVLTTDSPSVPQMVAVNLGEEELYDEQDAQQEQSYHFAMCGRSFAVINEHFPQLVQKVQTPLRTHKYLLISH